MTPNEMERTSGQKRRKLDQLVLDDGLTQHTIDGPIASYQDGFHWRAIVDATPITIHARGLRAIGVLDETVVAVGVVDNLRITDNADEVTLYIRP